MKILLIVSFTEFCLHLHMTLHNHSWLLKKIYPPSRQEAGFCSACFGAVIVLVYIHSGYVYLKDQAFITQWLWICPLMVLSYIELFRVFCLFVCFSCILPVSDSWGVSIYSHCKLLKVFANTHCSQTQFGAAQICHRILDKPFVSGRYTHQYDILLRQSDQAMDALILIYFTLLVQFLCCPLVFMLSHFMLAFFFFPKFISDNSVSLKERRLSCLSNERA